MRILSILIALLVTSYLPAQVTVPVATNGACTVGGVKVVTQGMSSTNYVQASYPRCNVEVFNSGTTTHATIYSSNTEGPLSNPFTANADGSWLFYSAPSTSVDVVLSGGTPNSFPQPVTLVNLIPGGLSGGGGGGNIDPAPQYSLYMQPSAGTVAHAGPSQLKTDGTGDFFSPGGIYGVGLNTNLANSQIMGVGQNNSNISFDSYAAFNGNSFHNVAFQVSYQSTYPGYSGNQGGWTTINGHDETWQAYSSGIFNPFGYVTTKSGTGDFGALLYGYVNTSWGATAPNDEGVKPISINLNDNPTCQMALAASSTNPSLVHMAFGASSCSTPGVGQYLTKGVNLGSPINAITNVANSNFYTTLTTSNNVPVSAEWGKLAASIDPPPPVHPEDPTTWPTYTVTVNVDPASPTVPAGTDEWACVASGTYERVAMVAGPVTGSAPNLQQTWTGPFIHGHYVQSDTSGWIFFGGLCASTNAMDIAANRTTTTSGSTTTYWRYPVPILGATGSNTVIGEANFQGYSQAMQLGGVNFTQILANNITRNGNVVTFTTIPSQIQSNPSLVHSSIFFRGTTDPSLAASACTTLTVTNTLIATLTCQQAGPDITTADSGTAGLDNGAYDPVSIDEIVDVRDLTQPGSYTDFSTTPPTFHASQQINGTYHLVPNPDSWNANDTVFLFNHYLASGAMSRELAVTHNMITPQWNQHVEGISSTNPGNYATQWIGNTTSIQDYQGFGGTFFAPHGYYFNGIFADFATFTRAPNPYSNFISVACPGTANNCGDGTYPGYNFFSLTGNGGSHTLTWNPFLSTSIDNVTGSGGTGSRITRTPSSTTIQQANQTMVMNGTNTTFNMVVVAPSINAVNTASAFAVGTTVGGQPICLTNGVNCRPLQVGGVNLLAQNGLNFSAGFGIDITNPTADNVVIAQTAPMIGTITLTAATSDTITINGINAPSVCNFSPDNAAAATAMAAGDVIQGKGTNQYTMVHLTTDAGAIFDVSCQNPKP